MAIKFALLCFKFEHVNGLTYDPELDFEFAPTDPSPGEGVQPVVAEAFKQVKACIAASISASFKFGHTTLNNINNFLHIGTSILHAEVQHTDGTYGQTSTIFTAKFYRLDPNTAYKVTVDLEEMPSSALDRHEPDTFRHGMSNKDIVKLVELLDEKFSLCGQIEHTPIIKRGRLDAPRFLLSSDERVMEYDFDAILFHKRSQFQDVKIVSSPSLGNTLLLDNLQNLAEVDLEYTYTLMDRGNVCYKNREILILGGGDGGLLWELLKEEPKFVTMAEIDPVVIEACRDHLRPCGEVLKSLQGSNYKIIIDDCMKVLRQSISEGKKYDVIFNDLTDIPVSKREESLTAFEPSVVQKDNQWHFIEAIFNLSLDCLAEDGLYMNHATGKGSINSLKAYEDFLRKSPTQLEFKSRQSYVPSFMEIWVFYTISKKNSTSGDRERASSGRTFA